MAQKCRVLKNSIAVSIAYFVVIFVLVTLIIWKPAMEKPRGRKEDPSSHMLENVCILFLGACRLHWVSHISMGSTVLSIGRHKKSKVRA